MALTRAARVAASLFAALALLAAAGCASLGAHPHRLRAIPRYIGLRLRRYGWALWLAQPAALAAPLLFVAYVTRFQILPEERALQARFGAAYADYRRQVRRWL